MSRADYHLLLIVVLAAALAYSVWRTRGELDYLADTILERTASMNGQPVPLADDGKGTAA